MTRRRSDEFANGGRSTVKLSGGLDGRCAALAAVVIALLATLVARLVSDARWLRLEARLSGEVHGWLPPALDSSLGYLSLNDRYAYAVAGLAWVMWAIHRRLISLAVLVCGTCVTGAVALLLARAALDRHRPPAFDSLGMAASWRFPSGHAFASALLATLATGLMLAGRWRPFRNGIALAWTWAASVGLLKLVAGNHYLGDIIVGWLMGAAWACVALCVFLAVGGSTRRSYGGPGSAGAASSQPRDKLRRLSRPRTRGTRTVPTVGSRDGSE